MVVKPPDRLQVCTQCGWTEPKESRWDRRRKVYKIFWRANTCPECDGDLARSCPNCEHEITSADAKSCDQCGQTYPWSTRA